MVEERSKASKGDQIGRAVQSLIHIGTARPGDCNAMVRLRPWHPRLGAVTMINASTCQHRSRCTLGPFSTFELCLAGASRPGPGTRTCRPNIDGEIEDEVDGFEAGLDLTLVGAMSRSTRWQCRDAEVLPYLSDGLIAHPARFKGYGLCPILLVPTPVEDQPRSIGPASADHSYCRKKKMTWLNSR